MSLRKYAAACSGFVSELKGGLTKEDVDGLREDLKAMGARNWIVWGIRNEQHVYLFVSATPKERARRKEWQDPVAKRRLTLAAIWWCWNAESLLRILDEAFLQPGISYRDMAAEAGRTLEKLKAVKNLRWPFEGDNPFSG